MKKQRHLRTNDTEQFHQWIGLSFFFFFVILIKGELYRRRKAFLCSSFDRQYRSYHPSTIL